MNVLLKRFREEYPEEVPRLAAALGSATEPVGSQAAYLAPMIRRIVRGEEPEPIVPDMPATVPRPGSRLARQQESSLIADDLDRMGYFEDSPSRKQASGALPIPSQSRSPRRLLT